MTPARFGVPPIPADVLRLLIDRKPLGDAMLYETPSCPFVRSIKGQRGEILTRENPAHMDAAARAIRRRGPAAWSTVQPARQPHKFEPIAEAIFGREAA